MSEIIINGVRLGGFPVLWAAEHYKGDTSTNKRFSASFLVPKDSEADKAIEAAIEAAALAAWGAKSASMLAKLRGDKGKFCYRDGDESTDSTGEPIAAHEGCMILATHRQESQGAPGIFDMDKSPITSYVLGRPKGGSQVRAKVEIWIQGGKYPGVRASFSAIQFVKHGDSLGGSSAPNADGFDVVEVEDDRSAAGFV